MEYKDLNKKIEEILDKRGNNIESLALRKMLEYGTFTLTDRAIVNIRDGLKPVHKRFLYAMKSIGLVPSSAHKKCARIVGDTIGKYHPHGDASVYNALVGYSQSWNKNLPLVDGEGNFGSVDGDNAAAYRYTEARLSPEGLLMFQDFDKKVVPMVPNFDDTEKEPAYLPAPFPNLVINGAYGIAVGMISSIPLHNSSETLKAVKYITEQKMKDKEIKPERILGFIPAPDFPTGGIIYNTESMIDVIKSGIGKMRLRARMHVEDLPRNKKAIIITELPYQVKKAPLVEKIGALVRNKDIEGVTRLRDDTSKNEIRIYIELKADANPDLIWSMLIKNTELEKTISYNCLVINETGEPEVLGIQSLLESFVDFRKEIIVNKYTFIKNKAELKLELLEGVLLALVKIDEVVKIIRGSKEESIAIEQLIKKIGLNIRQAKAILELRLQKLVGKEFLKVEMDIKELKEIIKDANRILNSDTEQYEIIIAETAVVRKQIASKRKTEISGDNLELEVVDVVPEEEILVSFTKRGYIRREPMSTKNKKDMELQEGDMIIKKLVTSSHNILSFISDKGRLFNISAHDITDAPRGKYIVDNMFDFEKGEEVIALLDIKPEENKELLLITSKGFLKRLSTEGITDSMRRNGFSICKLANEEDLFFANIAQENEKVILLSNANKIIKFNIADVSVFGRSSRGVTGIKDAENVVFAQNFTEDEDNLGFVACLTEKSMIKPTLVTEIKVQKRAGKGVHFEPTKNIIKYIYLLNDDLCLRDSEKELFVPFDRIQKAAEKGVGLASQKMNQEYVVLKRSDIFIEENQEG